MKPIVCVTEKEYYKAEDVFKNSEVFSCIPVSFEEKTLTKEIKDKAAFAAILGVEQYSNELYSVLPKGGIIARFGVGHDGVDKNKATDAGIIVTNTPGVLDDSVAEHAVWLMGSLARGIALHANNMKNEKWDPGLGFELKDKTLLVLGCGNIGRKVAKIAGFGFGMNVIGYDVADLDEDKMKKEFGFDAFVNCLDDVLGQVDFISIHLPSVTATRQYIDKDFLKKLKPLCYIINTARGSVVDELALYEVLKENKIGGAGIDVFETEPYEPVEPDKDLRSLDNVILTPHVGSSTFEACKRMAESCLENIKAAYEKNYKLLDIVNQQVLEKL